GQAQPTHHRIYDHNTTTFLQNALTHHFSQHKFDVLPNTPNTLHKSHAIPQNHIKSMKYLLLAFRDIHPNPWPPLELMRHFPDSYAHNHDQYFTKGITNLKDKFTHLN